MYDPSFDRLQRFLGPARDEHLIVVTFEQLIRIRDLIRINDIGNLRMAVIALDHLAEVMLHRRVEKQIRLGDESWLFRCRRYSRAERNRLRSTFDAKVEAVFRYRRCPNDFLSNMLTAGNAAILSIAHQYRNAIYHRDIHNERFLPFLARLHFVAVTKTFARSFPLNVFSGGAYAKEYRRRLAGLGFGIAVDDDSFNGWEVAELCASQTVKGMSVPRKDLRFVLTADVDDRIELLRNAIAALVRDGVPNDNLAQLVAMAEFKDTHGEDSALLQLGDELARVTQRLFRKRELGDADIELLEERRNTLEKRQRDRIEQLAKSFQPTAFQKSTRGPLVERFRSAATTADVLRAYRSLDVQLRREEGYLLSVAEELDEAAEREVDRRRGK